MAVQTNDNERVNVYIDGDWAIGISLDTLQREGLYRGKLLDTVAWSRLERAESDHRAWQAALQLLEHRPRTEHELRDRLTRKEFDPTQIDMVLLRMRELGFVDDHHWAQLWVAQRAASRPKGAAVLRQELIAHGISRELAAEVVQEASSPALERQQCWQVARQALRKYAAAPDRATFQRKLGSYLARRGYRFETMKPVLDALWRELHATAGENEDTAYESE
ncbi:MAG: RecX family transcriptional regulator [Herpetosiphon sp.]